MADYGVQNGDDPTVIDRSTTGKRFLLTILFVIIVRLVEAVLAIVIVFELFYSLVTRRPPAPRVTRFAHRMLRYGLEIGQYLTCNTDRLPFPFEELPNGNESMDLGSAATP
jgi:hypothetical protein